MLYNLPIPASNKTSAYFMYRKVPICKYFSYASVRLDGIAQVY
jgi:hypothetical protein